MNADKSSAAILWRQVWGLAAVQGAITLTWVIYKLYAPQLLMQFGFSQELAATLLIVENALAIALEPLMGGLSDGVTRWMGTRFPWISLGVILSSALFIAIPAVAIFGNPAGDLRTVLPVLMVAWALAMTVFRAPAIALLGRYAAVRELPRAASLLILVGGVIGAIGPFSREWILKLGPAVTFATGSIVLLGAVGVLRSLNPPEPPTHPTETPVEEVETSRLLTALGLIFGTGVFVAWGIRFLMDILPKAIALQFPAANIKLVMLGIAIALAVTAVPAGELAVRLGNRRGMLAGIGGTVGVLLIISLVPNAVILVAAAIALVASLSLVNNGAVPFALGLVPAHRSGLAVGTYFGAVGAAFSLSGVVFGWLGDVTPVVGARVGAIAFVAAGLCIALSRKVVPANT